MIYIVFLFITSPVLVMLFFAVYKTVLFIIEQHKRRRYLNDGINGVKESIPVVVPASQSTIHSDAEEEEISTVISAAVHYYLNQKKI